jgi:hypothetical protein
MTVFITFALRLLFVAAGVVFAASLAIAFAAMAVVWLARAGWARLTGRPVTPFVMRIDPRMFGRMHRGAGDASRTPRADAATGRQRVADVMDVEPK